MKKPGTTNPDRHNRKRQATLVRSSSAEKALAILIADATGMSVQDVFLEGLHMVAVARGFVVNGEIKEEYRDAMKLATEAVEILTARRNAAK